MLKTLIAIRLKGLLHSMGNRSGKASTPGRVILYVLLFLYVAGCMLFLFGMTFRTLADAFYPAGLGWLYFALWGLLSLTLMVVGTVFTAKSQLFEATDNELLLSMPLPPRLILLSRMAVLLVMNLVFHLLVSLPAAVMWWQVAPVHAGGLGAFILLALALPLLAMALSGLLGWLLALAGGHVRNQSLFTVVLSVLFLVAYFAAVQNIEKGLMLLVSNGDAVAAGLKGFAPLYWLGQAVAGPDLWCLLGALAVLVVPFAVVCWLLSRTFLTLATRKKSGPRIVYREQTLTVTSPGKALLRREFQRLWASPLYLLNDGMGSMMLIIGAVALVLMRGQLLAALSQMDMTGPYAAAGLTVAVLFLAGMCVYTAPSVSLEGKSWWIIRSMPLTAREVLRPKLQMHLWLTLPPALLAEAVVIGITGCDLATGAALVGITVLFVLFTALVGLLAGLRHAVFDWLSETQVIKQGMAMMVAMLSGMGVTVGVAVLGLVLAAREWPVWAAVLVPALLLAGGCALLFHRYRTATLPQG